MTSQIQAVLLPVLLAALIGLLVGGGLVAAVMAWRRRDLPAGPVPIHRPAAAAAAAVAGMRLPRRVEPSAAAPRSRAARASASNLPQVADLLLVDDSAVARAKLRRLFEPAGYQVHLANDGVEALALLAKGRYGMMITDLEMPNMDGVTLINTCLAQPQTARMPILAISGHESLRARFNECREVCGVHKKPWVDDVLLSHVGTLVGSRSTSLATH